ncbi:Multimodular transpeptidase-transglycosylase, partial [hydrothermal vent metagenome]
MNPVIKKITIYGLAGLFSLSLLGGLGFLGIYAYITPNLPDIETLKDVQLKVPLRIYTKDGLLLAEFGEMKRTPLRYQELPDTLVKALIAAEDDRFFEHPGVDYKGILRAALHLIRTGERAQGGSTITMQVARNFFLSREKTFLRKFNEIFLAFKIEEELTKQEILELYLNKIYFGKRAYGVAAAAQVYYGKSIDELNLTEIAMIVGLPKAPSRYNPIVNPSRALLRRNYVLGRMRDLNFITQLEYDEAFAMEDNAAVHGQNLEVEAPYIAEMVRSEMLKRYGNKIYTQGYQAYTTVDSKLQIAANKALRLALHEYGRRHGYRGTIGHVELFNFEFEDDEEYWDSILAEQPAQGDLIPAIVFQVEEQSAYAYTADGNVAFMDWPQLEWARRYIDEFNMGPKLDKASQIVKSGDVIYIVAAKKGCSFLAQVPIVSGALVSLNPDDGAIQSLVGGFDFYQSKFNRVIQAKRQPGSSFKPFIYSAALDKGFTAASIINDAPVVFDAPGLEDTWRPENYTGKWYGETRLRTALIKSRNLVSIRLLRDIGIGYAVRYVTRFGFKRSSLPRDLSLALGSGAITPLELAEGFSVFANGGFKVQPYFIEYILNADKTVMMLEQRPEVCVKCVEEMEAKLKLEQEREAAKLAEQETKLKSLSGATNEISVAQNQPAKKTAPLVANKGKASAPEAGSVLADNTVTTNAEVIFIEQTGPQQIKVAPRVLDAPTTFLIDTMMRDVVRYGTGRRALALRRKDLAGKTGTTNDQRDAWFSGFNRNVVTITWVGFDNPRSLGSRETGAIAALPMWTAYMGQALKGVPEAPLEQPASIV